jgi:hypothetical protein
VQLINGKSYHDKPEYNDKYTKFAYSTIFSYDARTVYGNFNCDNVLQFSQDGINFRQRWEMESLFCERDFAVSRYPLHEVDPAGSATSAILVKGDALINLHQVTATRALVLREGGYPLGFDDGAAEVVSAAGAEAAYKDDRVTFIRNLGGWTRQHPARGFADDVNGSNVRYRQSVVPALGHETTGPGTFTLGTLVCARVGADSIESLMGLVTEVDWKGNQARLAFADGERAFVQLGAAAAVTVNLNGKSFAGEIVMARVSADGGAWFVLRQDGSVEQS